MNILLKIGRSQFFLLAALLLAGCGTVYVNEEDRNLGASERDSFAVERSVDSVYRELYGRLGHCVSIYSYRVRGNITRDRDAAHVTVDSGVGFDRVLYLADSFFLRAELERLGPERTSILQSAEGRCSPAAMPDRAVRRRSNGGSAIAAARAFRGYFPPCTGKPTDGRGVQGRQGRRQQ